MGAKSASLKNCADQIELAHASLTLLGVFLWSRDLGKGNEAVATTLYPPSIYVCSFHVTRASHDWNWPRRLKPDSCPDVNTCKGNGQAGESVRQHGLPLAMAAQLIEGTQHADNESIGQNTEKQKSVLSIFIMQLESCDVTVR